METTPGAVVVAVGGQGATAAVEYGAGEAMRRHRTLHLVHAVPLDPADHVDAAGETELLEDATRRATSLLGGLGLVTSALVPGQPVPVIAEAAHGADLVVVGRCAESRRTHPYVRSVTGGIGARVDVAVVSVPDEWRPRAGVPTVVAGVNDPEKCSDVLVAAFAAARDRRARLLVVSTMWRPAEVHLSDPGWAQRVEDELASALEVAGAAYPDVPVELHVRNARAGEALIEASQHADLVVVGRHNSLLPSGSHLGPIARSVLRESACPVLLATPRILHQVRMRASRKVTSPS